MKRIYATLLLTLFLISIGWVIALATTPGEQAVLDAMKSELIGLPSDWISGTSDTACTNTVDWSGLGCDISNTITDISLPNAGILGNIPSLFNGTSLANLTSLDISNNGLFSSNTDVVTFINGFQPNWKDTQAVPPINLAATALNDDIILLQWTPNPDYGSGFSDRLYNIYRTNTSGSGYISAGSGVTTTSIADSGLTPFSTYFYIVNSTSTGLTFESVASTEVSAQTAAVSNTTGGDDTSAANEACYIATAAYGSYLDPHVQTLRDFRDDVLLKSAVGRELVELYYRTSPPLAEFIRKHEGARAISRIALTPIVLGVAFPGVTFAMAFGIGVWGGFWMRKRRKIRSLSQY